MASVIIPSQERVDPASNQASCVTFTQKTYGENPNDIWQHITINLQTEVIDAETVRRQANVWLLTYVGNLLRAENPELILDAPLQWRFDIRLTLPDANISHPLVTGVIGKIHFNALTGETMIPKNSVNSFIDELQTYADQLIAH